MPVAIASRKKPAISASDMRLEIVIVSRSLDAANAISDGNNSSLMVSMTMTQTPCHPLLLLRGRSERRVKPARKKRKAPVKDRSLPYLEEVVALLAGVSQRR